MTQDFAKIRPEPLLERKPVEAPPAWSLMLTGVLVGLAVGVFGSFMFYLSGNVPPLTNSAMPVMAATAQEIEPTPEPVEEARVNFEFYTALPDYEVRVDATPVTLTAPETAPAPVSPADTPLAMSVVLQSGAFQQEERAYAEMRRQLDLGLDVRVKQESTLPGRTLFLVQSGPYTSQNVLVAAERLLRNNSIQTLRISPR